MTFVLVHGGAHTGACWARLAPHLEAPSLAIDLPGRGSRPAPLVGLRVDDWVDAIVEEIESRSGEPILLVGHSLAGLSLPRVAERVPERLAHLVFVSCAVPPEGRRVIDMLPAETRVLAEHQDLDVEPPVLPEELARAMFCNDMDEEQARFVLDGLVPEATRPPFEPSRLAGLANGIPMTYVRLLRDAVVPLGTQDAYIAAIRGVAPVSVVELDAGHDAMVSQPEALAAILNEIHAHA
jgi:pimeloyl-ACP methyl ester carboxylesterase